MAPSQDTKVRERAAKRRWYLKHKEEHKARTRAHQIENKEQVSTYKKEWYKKNKVAQRLRVRFNRYGITKAKYDALLKAQHNCCAICRQPLVEGKAGESIDHCHKTDVVRGILCGACNKALGFVRESVSILEAMIAYVRKHQGKD